MTQTPSRWEGRLTLEPTLAKKKLQTQREKAEADIQPGADESCFCHADNLNLSLKFEESNTTSTGGPPDEWRPTESL
ncbi:hypothetical protein EYF80_058814 [Liparis tanakae]|uniref:Uncharacterized protein n=1 Tax=Liparis tanakae TaxID=230148 RepID=A0A4Z2ERN8_9TELE|nr:hypothetical protein EYF80_058814 [Liparis tanakae]